MNTEFGKKVKDFKLVPGDKIQNKILQGLKSLSGWFRKNAACTSTISWDIQLEIQMSQMSKAKI